MRAIVVELDGADVVVMNKKGQFIKLKNSGNLKVGYEIDIPDGISLGRNFMRRAVAIAAILIFALGLSSYGVYSYTKPYSYITVDINPSMEIVTNRFDRVLSVRALNDDGLQLLKSGVYKNRKLNEAVGSIIESAINEGYIKSEEENAVILTVASLNEAKAHVLEEGISYTVKRELDDSDCISTELKVVRLNAEKREEARDMGISPGKLLLISQLKELDGSISVDEQKGMPVKSIMKAIKDIKMDRKADQKEDKKADQKEDKKTDRKAEQKVDGKPEQKVDGENKPEQAGLKQIEKDQKDKEKDDVIKDALEEGRQDVGKQQAGQEIKQQDEKQKIKKQGENNGQKQEADRPEEKQDNNEKGTDKKQDLEEKDVEMKNKNKEAAQEGKQEKDVKQDKNESTQMKDNTGTQGVQEPAGKNEKFNIIKFLTGKKNGR